MASNKPIDFIGIGTYKSGTGTIHRFLEAHPDICFSIPKEVRWFNEFEYASTMDLTKNRSRNKTIEWYHNHWKHRKQDQLLGEFSPVYFADPSAPEKIHHYNPKIKLLVSFRDPVSRIHSDFLMKSIASNKEHLNFSEAIRTHHRYIDNSKYFTHLQRYLKLFQKEQIHIVFTEDFKNDLKNEITDLLNFLEADNSFFPKNLAKKNNPAKKYKSPIWRKIHQTVRALSSHGGSPIIHQMRKYNLHLVFEKYTTQPIAKEAIPFEDRAYILSNIKEDILGLQDLVKRDLSHWLGHE